MSLGASREEAMLRELTAEQLWESVRADGAAFRPETLCRFPEDARRYLGHAIAPGIPLARAVRLHMHGEIKLRRWCPFVGEHVLVWDRGMIWKARVGWYGMPILGSDRLVDGQGDLHWKLFGMIPVMTASGPDITRSAAGRVAGESIWLPSVLQGDGVSWTATEALHPRVILSAGGFATDVALAIDAQGRLQSVKFSRWGNPDGGDFRYTDFGGVVEDERMFGGYRIPTRLRLGWYFGTDHFKRNGEFFRVTVDEAEYR